MDTPHPTPDPEAPISPATDPVMAPYMAAIRRGAQFLDTAVPDWWRPNCATPIRVEFLNLGNFTHCILGQLTAATDVRSFHHWWLRIRDDRRLTADVDAPQSTPTAVPQFPPPPTAGIQAFRAWAEDHGFYPPEAWYRRDSPTCHISWEGWATASWASMIVRRRATFNLPLDPPQDTAVSGCPECDSGNTPHTLDHEGKP